MNRAEEEGKEKEKLATEAKAEEKKKHLDKKRKRSLSIEELEQLKEKAKLTDNYLDRLLRLQAELDNFKKRTEKEKAEFLKYANEGLIYELLGAIDNFERAVEAAEKKEDFSLLHQGVEMILKELHQILKRKGVTRIEALGAPFDPHKHEALTYVTSEEHPENIVIEEIRKGYLLENRIIRPAIVKVSKKEVKNNEVKNHKEEGLKDGESNRN